jgi:hypothetical protein
MKSSSSLKLGDRTLIRYQKLFRFYTLAIPALLLAAATTNDNLALADPSHYISFQCYLLGFQAGAWNASYDYNRNNGYNNSCPQDHSNSYCAGYVAGYSHWWSGVDQQQTIYTQAQSSAINTKGNNNRVQVNQAQSVQRSNGYSDPSGDLSSCRLICTLIK